MTTIKRHGKRYALRVAYRPPTKWPWRWMWTGEWKLDYRADRAMQQGYCWGLHEQLRNPPPVECRSRQTRTEMERTLDAAEREGLLSYDPR